MAAKCLKTSEVAGGNGRFLCVLLVDLEGVGGQVLLWHVRAFRQWLRLHEMSLLVIH